MGELLVVENLGKTYGDIVPTPALKGVSFTVECGEFSSIVGRSGSGKSTLLNLIGLLDTPTTGTVRLSDRDTGGLDSEARAALRNRTIGFVFQFHHLLPEFSVMENVFMPSLISGEHPTADLRRRTAETLEALGLDDVADKNANQISGGQRQRVAVARALMNRPELVLADEPTGNLDTENSDLVYELFRQVNRDWGTGFLIVTHDRGIAQQTDRILELKDGRLLQDVRSPYSEREDSVDAGSADAPPDATDA